MTLHDPNEDRLERLAHAALQQLPTRRAPATLEARVLGEIERRTTGARAPAVLWRAGRGLMVMGSALCVPLVWLLGPLLWAHLRSSGAAPRVAHIVNGVSVTGHTIVSLAELAAHLTHLIPKEWLLGGFLVTSAVYATLLAVGYLLLYPSSPHSKVHSV